MEDSETEKASIHRSGLAKTELDVITAIARAKRNATTLDVIERVVRLRGGASSLAVVAATMTTMSLGTRLNFPMVEFDGNGGTWDDGPDEPQNTKVSLSRFGMWAFRAASGEAPPIPWDFLNGSLHREGIRAGVSTEGIAQSIHAAASGQASDNPSLKIAIASGCIVDGDKHAYFKGDPTEFVLSARIEESDSGALITGTPRTLVHGG